VATHLREAGSQRRRSHRIQVFTPVEVAWHTAEGIYTRKQAQTVQVNAHGALLRTEHGLPSRGLVAVSTSKGANWAMARVVRYDFPRAEGWTPVAIELDSPSEAFWGIVSWSGA
jgi:hypothetical protein